jgi:hypothetical protein
MAALVHEQAGRDLDRRQGRRTFSRGGGAGGEARSDGDQGDMDQAS